jgi:hypothetical protein
VARDVGAADSQEAGAGEGLEGDDGTVLHAGLRTLERFEAGQYAQRNRRIERKRLSGLDDPASLAIGLLLVVELGSDSHHDPVLELEAERALERAASHPLIQRDPDARGSRRAPGVEPVALDLGALGEEAVLDGLGQLGPVEAGEPGLEAQRVARGRLQRLLLTELAGERRALASRSMRPTGTMGRSNCSTICRPGGTSSPAGSMSRIRSAAASTGAGPATGAASSSAAATANRPRRQTIRTPAPPCHAASRDTPTLFDR